MVGALSAVDPDAGDSVTFTLLDNDGGLFAVSGGNLVVGADLAGVTAATQNVTVRATDAGGLTFDKVFALSVTGIPGNTFAGDSGDNTLNGTLGNDRFQGFAGNDTINGDLGFDRAIYTDATAGIAFNLASGTVTGAGVGTDTLTGIEGIIGTNFADTYDAAGYSPAAPAHRAHGSVVDEFEGMGGDDTVTELINAQGAALTRVSYLDATAGVTVNLTTRVADGDASVGHDTFTNTISNVLGSNFADTLTGSNNPGGTVEVFEGRGGDDIINGGGSFDRSDYINDLTETTGITVNLAAGTVTGSSVAGNDTLRSIEAVRGTAFADHYDAAGSAAPAPTPARSGPSTSSPAAAATTPSSATAQRACPTTTPPPASPSTSRSERPTATPPADTTRSPASTPSRPPCSTTRCSETPTTTPSPGLPATTISTAVAASTPPPTGISTSSRQASPSTWRPAR